MKGRLAPTPPSQVYWSNSVKNSVFTTDLETLDNLAFNQARIKLELKKNWADISEIMIAERKWRG